MYLHLPLSLPGQQDVDGKYLTEDKIVPLKFLPNQIACYHESFYDNQTVIYLQNGQPFILAIPVSEYEDSIKQYWDKVASQQKAASHKQDIKSKLGIIR